MRRSLLCFLGAILLCACKGSPVGEGGAPDGAAGTAGSGGAGAAGGSGGSGGWPTVAPSCGDTSGLQAGAPWPMEGFCPTRQGRSDRAPQLGAKLKWTIHFDDPIATTPVISASGSVFVGTQTVGGSAAALHRVDGPDAKVWSLPVAGAYAALATPAIGSNGNLHVVTYDQLLAVRDNGDVAWQKPIGTSAYPAPATLGAGGVIYVAQGASPARLFAFSPTGDTLWVEDLPGLANAQPAVGLDGTVYVTWEKTGTDLSAEVGLSAYSSAGALLWSRSVRQFAQLDAVGLALEGGPVVLDNGSVAVAAGDAVFEVNEQQASKLADLGAEPLVDPVVGPDALLVVSTRAGRLVALHLDGVEQWSRTGPANPKTMALGGNGVLLYAGSSFSASLGGLADTLFVHAPDGAPLPSFEGELSVIAAVSEGGVALNAEGASVVGLGRGLYVVGD